uniref:Flocculation protein FLO11-like n=1 Tax=Steinernema glaseri TaxID=37863 RepID=A0A1I7ZX72_9BILA
MPPKKQPEVEAEIRPISPVKGRPEKKLTETEVEFRPISPAKERKMKAAASKSPSRRGRPPGSTNKSPKTPRSSSRRASVTRKPVTEPARPASRSGTRTPKIEKEVKLTNKTIVVETPVIPRTTRVTRSAEVHALLHGSSKVETRASRSRAAALSANTASSSAPAVPQQMTSEEEKALRRRITAASSVSPSVTERNTEVTRSTGGNVKDAACKMFCSSAFKVVVGIFILFTVYYFTLKYFPNIKRDTTVFVTNNYYIVREQAAESFNKLYQSLPSMPQLQDISAPSEVPAEPAAES